MTVIRNLDLLLLALALPVFLVAGLPLLGWVAAVVIWAMWRGIGAYAEKRAERTEDPRATVGIVAGSMIGRGWLLGLMLLAFGLGAGDDAVGLSAAVLVLALFTVHFTFKLIAGSAGREGASTT